MEEMMKEVDRLARWTSRCFQVYLLLAHGGAKLNLGLKQDGTLTSVIRYVVSVSLAEIIRRIR